MVKWVNPTSIIWSNDFDIGQVPDINTQSNQRVGSQSQLWQGKILLFKYSYEVFLCSSGSQPIQSQSQYPGIIVLSSNFEIWFNWML